ncbi:MAG: TonB-dependent receptor plug domain-containing protein, partial [Muribaculaceae bacterium]|nr:TonB-dependent receptor plug domain-containing protein [Muribaculaceae bacterium]
MSVMANAGITLTTGADTRLGDVISSIQKQSDYKFFYDDNIAAVKAKSVTFNDENVDQALKKLFDGTSVSYVVKDKVVYLRMNNGAGSGSKSQTAITRGSKTHKISGVILDENGEPLIGASVRIKGTTLGVTTDFDGNYTIETSEENPVLECTYVGYKPKEIKTNGQATVDFEMLPDSQMLDEVVVTALGIKREQKSLSYNVQQLNGDALSENKDANFINGLAGKVAGVNINASSSGVGGISKVVMRGTKSIMQSSNALYVVDGMPMRSANNGGSTEFGSQGATEPIADINPEDIESMSVLTGAAAAALYGSEAANGAIVITTKKGQAGKTKVTVNSSLQWDRALVNHRLQSRYGTGINGAYVPTSNMSWGAPLSPYNNYNYQPSTDYFQTGFVSTQSMTFSTGNDKNQTYASAAAVNSLGITPNNRYNRYNFNIRNTTSFLNDRMTLDVNASYIHQTDRNMVNQGTYGNPLVGALLYPRGNSWDDVRAYERWDAERKIYVQNWGPGDYGMTVQ